MTTVLTDNELLTLYDNHNDAIANFDTGVAVGMGVEDERRAMWDAFAAYKAAQRRLNVAILRRHEGRLARALEAREVRGWLDALAEVLGLVEKPAEAKPASKGKVRWGRSRYCSHDDALLVNDGNGSCVGVVDYKDGSWCWFVDKYPHHCGSMADSIAGLVAHLRAEGYDVESLK